jgi:hypothetical protein
VILDTRVTIGADPELFAKVNGVFRSVHDLLPGTKWEPHKVLFGAVQVDGVSAEFNIEPAKNSGEFLRNIKVVRHSMLKMLRNAAKDHSINLVAEPTAIFDEVYFKSLPEVALALGCEPDFNAYTRDVNEKPFTERPMRTGSGHVHIGWDDDTKKTEDHLVNLVKDLDFALGRQAVIWDKDEDRRTLYGQRGAFRPKSYGLEYRVLSNAWLRSDKLIEFVFECTKRVAEYSLNSPISLHEEGTNTAIAYSSFLEERGIPVMSV